MPRPSVSSERYSALGATTSAVTAARSSRSIEETALTPGAHARAEPDRRAARASLGLRAQAGHLDAAPRKCLVVIPRQAADADSPDPASIAKGGDAALEER